MMAHAQKPDFVFRRNGQVHLHRRGRQFSQLLAAEVCASAVVMLDTPSSDVVWRVLATHSIRHFSLHFPPVRHRVPSRFNWTLPTLWNSRLRTAQLLSRFFPMLLFKSCTYWCFYSVWSFSIVEKSASVFLLLLFFVFFCFFFCFLFVCVFFFFLSFFPGVSLTSCATLWRASETRKGTSWSIAIVTSQNFCSVLDADSYNSRIRYLIWLKCLCVTFVHPHAIIWLWININFTFLIGAIPMGCT